MSLPGGELFSPDVIEHGILRANKRHPYQQNDQIHYLSDGDVKALVACDALGI